MTVINYISTLKIRVLYRTTTAVLL